jgi:4-hydroxyphenylpyruvate dioxygenase
MPVSSSKPASQSAEDDPVGLQGMAFVEFSATDSASVAALLGRLGFTEIGRHSSRALGVWAQGAIRLLLNSQPGTHGYEFARVHGPSISSIAFLADDSVKARDRALARGATAYIGEPPPAFGAPALEGIGGSLLYLIDKEGWDHFYSTCNPVEARERDGNCGLVAIDHLTHNVRVGELERWVRYYKEVFGFHEFYYLDAQGTSTGFRTKAVRSSRGGIRIPINEPTDPKSQIQEFIDRYQGEGVQHIALSTPTIYASVEALRHRGIPFMQVLDSYYDSVDERLPGHRQSLEQLRSTRVLIDGSRQNEDQEWKLLLQIFSEALVGPIFFEIIQRKGNEGFGDANARALFEAIEQDQIRRGVLSPR